MFCPRCGVDLVEGVRFCRQCGADLTALAAAPPVAGVPETVAGGPPATGDEGRDGPSWERRESTFDMSALVETITAVLFRPGETFSTMRRRGGIESPLLFALIPGVVAFVISALLQAAMLPRMQSMIESMKDQLPSGFADLVVNAGAGGPLAQAVGLVVGVLWMVAALFIVSAVLHGCLFLVGGATAPWETTFRTYCYIKGSIALIQALPGCGSAVALVWAPILLIIGLARTHETDAWRTAVAVSIPALLCCGAIGGMMAIGFSALNAG